MPHKQPPLYLVDDNLILNDPNAISMYLAGSSNIIGHNLAEQMEVYLWIEYYNMHVAPLLN
jgi:glutathione S-transferase